MSTAIEARLMSSHQSEALPEMSAYEGALKGKLAVELWEEKCKSTSSGEEAYRARSGGGNRVSR